MLDPGFPLGEVFLLVPLPGLTGGDAGDLVTVPLVFELGLFLLLVLRGFPDLLVALLPHVFDAIGLDVVLGVLLELKFEPLGILLGQLVHVLVDVGTENPLEVSLGVVGVVHAPLFGLFVTAELLDGVGDVETAILSTLEDRENPGTHQSPDQTNVEDDLEGPPLVILVFDVEFFLVLLFDTLDLLVHTDLLEDPPGDQETGLVTSGVGGVANGSTVFLELGGGLLAESLITEDGGVDNLGDELLVGDPDNKSVLGGIVFVLILGHQSPPLVVVGLTFPTPSIFGLDPLVILLILLNLDETHFEYF